MLSNQPPTTPPLRQAVVPLAGRMDLCDSDWSPVEPFDTPPTGGQKVRSADRLDNRGASLHPSTPSTPENGKGNNAKARSVKASDYAQFQALYEARDLFRWVGARSVACCGLGTLTGTASLVREASPSGRMIARKVGVSHCSNPWLCPACGPVIAARRANDLAPQLNALVARGWTVWLATLTVRHKRGDDLGALLGLLAGAWAKLTQGKAFDKRRRAFGGFEYVRGYDWTFSQQHGAHPHIHAVLVFGPGAGDGRAEAEDLLCRWRGALSRLGAEALPRALDIQPATTPAAAAAYAMSLAGVSKKTDRQAAKMTGKEVKDAARVGFSTIAEATAAAAKRGRTDGGLTAADLREMALAGDGWARGMFAAYARATKGRRAVVVSQGLRLAPESEAREEEDVMEPEVVAVLRDKGLIAIDAHIARTLAAAASSADQGRAVLLEVLGAPGPTGLWCHPPVGGTPAGFGPLTADALALLASYKAERDAVRARKKARKATRGKN